MPFLRAALIKKKARLTLEEEREFSLPLLAEAEPEAVVVVVQEPVLLAEPVQEQELEQEPVQETQQEQEPEQEPAPEQELEQEPVHGWTLLMIAAYHNQFEIAKYLIQKGSDINAKNFKGTTVIMYAKNGMLSTGDDRLFKLLLEKGANPFVKDYAGKDLFGYIDEPTRLKVANCTLSDAVKQ